VSKEKNKTAVEVKKYNPVSYKMIAGGKNNDE